MKLILLKWSEKLPRRLFPLFLSLTEDPYRGLLNVQRTLLFVHTHRTFQNRPRNPSSVKGEPYTLFDRPYVVPNPNPKDSPYTLRTPTRKCRVEGHFHNPGPDPTVPSPPTVEGISRFARTDVNFTERKQTNPLLPK